MERLWLYLRERFLSLRVLKDYDAIVDACCIRSLCLYPFQKVIG
jgi:hypothetical protein